MVTVYNVKTGEPRACDSVDARELIETGRWSREPVEQAAPAPQKKK